MPWIATWGGRGVLRWDDGSPASFDPRPARLAIERNETGEDLWVVEYPPAPGLPEGTPGPTRPLDETVVFSDDERMGPALTTYHGMVSGPVKSFYTRRGTMIGRENQQVS